MRLKITCCKDCQTRTAGCHCPEFMAQKAEIEEAKRMIKQEKDIGFAVETLSHRTQGQRRMLQYIE